MPTRRMGSLIVAAIVLIAVGSLLASLELGGKRSPRAAMPLEPAQLADPAKVKGNITVWGWNIAAKGMRSVLPEFQKRYPNVAVNVEMTGANIQSRFLLSLSAGTGAPDVTSLQGHEAPRYIATGRMTDLTAVAMKYKDRFPASSWANCVHEGKVYAIPWDIGPCAVFYKRDIFERYGIDPESIETWDDFIAVGKTLRAKSGGKTKLMPLSINDLLPTYEMLLQQLSGQMFDAEGRIVVNSPQSRQVMELIRKLLDSGTCAAVDQWSHEWMAGLNADSIATYPGAVWLGGTMKDTTGDYGSARAKWGVFKLPAFEKGGLRTSNLGGSVLVIPDQCEQKAAAWAFIEYALCTKEGQVTQYSKFDLFPAFLPALQDPFFQEPDPFYGGQKVRAFFAAAVEGIPVLNRTADWVEGTNYARQSFTGWAANHEETGPMLEALEKRLHRWLGREISPQSLSAPPSASATTPPSTPSASARTQEPGTASPISSDGVALGSEVSR